MLEHSSGSVEREQVEALQEERMVEFCGSWSNPTSFLSAQSMWKAWQIT